MYLQTIRALQQSCRLATTCCRLLRPVRKLLGSFPEIETRRRRSSSKQQQQQVRSGPEPGSIELQIEQVRSAPSSSQSGGGFQIPPVRVVVELSEPPSSSPSSSSSIQSEPTLPVLVSPPLSVRLSCLSLRRRGRTDCRCRPPSIVTGPAVRAPGRRRSRSRQPPAALSKLCRSTSQPVSIPKRRRRIWPWRVPTWAPLSLYAPAHDAPRRAPSSSSA